MQLLYFTEARGKCPQLIIANRKVSEAFKLVKAILKLPNKVVGDIDLL